MYTSETEISHVKDDISDSENAVHNLAAIISADLFKD